MTHSTLHSRPRTVTGYDPYAPPAESAVREILFLSDLSPASERALAHARLLAEQLDAHLTLCHYVEAPRHERHRSTAEDEAERRLERAAVEKLSRDAHEIGVPTSVLVERATSVPRAVVKLLKTARPDLTVMATHGRHAVARLILGSITEIALREGGCPVLCIREPEHGAAVPYRRLLVPTDLGEASRRAFPLAATLARSFGAEVVALHVVPPPSLESLVGVSEAVDASLPEEAKVEALLRRDFPSVRLDVRIEMGSVWQVIVNTARAEKADLVVLSSHGHDSLADRVLGSHAERVVRLAPCPVLVA